MNRTFKGYHITVKCPKCGHNTFVQHYGRKVCGVLGCTHEFTPDRSEVDSQLIDKLFKETEAWAAAYAKAVAKLEPQLQKVHGNVILVSQSH